MCKSTLHRLLNIVRQPGKKKGERGVGEGRGGEREKRNGSRRKSNTPKGWPESKVIEWETRENEDRRGGVGEWRQRRKMETGRLKQGAAGDAPGGGRWRVRRFAPRLPVTCPGSTTPRPISLFLSRRGNLFFCFLFFRSVSSFFQSRRLRYFGTFVRPKHNKWQYVVKNVNGLRIEQPRDS